MNLALEVRGLSVSYGVSRAVSNLDLTVRAGHAVALLGPNGAGKTSTLRALSQQVRCEYSSLAMFGEVVQNPTVSGLAARGLIHVPEGRRVFSRLTVQENLEIGMKLAGDREGWSVDEVFDLFPALVRLRSREGGFLSGGEQQMVAIGRGLTAAPVILMLDEPSLGLAPKVASEVYEALGQIRSRTSLLIVEQNAALALRICGEATVMAGGKAVWHGATDALNQSELAASYLGTSAIHGEQPEAETADV